MESTQKRFRGLIAAPFTPFHADGSLDLDRIDALLPVLPAAVLIQRWIN